MTTLSNIKTYLPAALKHLFGCHLKNLWKKRNIIVTFQSGQLTKQQKPLDDLDCFDLKFYLNCPIRIKIITGSHMFILFYHGLSLYAFILPLATERWQVIKCNENNVTHVKT